MTELLSRAIDGNARANHPIELLRKEHELFLELVEELKRSAADLVAAGPDGAGPAEARVRALSRELKAGETHYFREENCLFPVMERHGIDGPPAVMWSEHDQIREAKRRIFAALTDEGGIPPQARREIAGAAAILGELLEMHFLKENQILFAMALHVVEDAEWTAMLRQFGEIGFWKVAPAGVVDTGPQKAQAMDGLVSFGSGSLPVATLEALLNTLPVEVTFVDANDQVRYFNQNPHRIFHRSTAAIGRQVHHCHPQKSVHLVQQVLSELKAGTRDAADFWIQAGGRFLLIRFLAVRDREGQYLGCMEVTQDVTDIRALEGEKRLL